MEISRILQIGSNLSYADLLFFAVCFLVGALLYFLGCLSKNIRFFFPQILKILAFCVWIATPIALDFLMQKVFYVPQIEYKMNKKLEYSPAYFVDAKLEGVGKFPIKKCYLFLEVLRPSEEIQNQILNKILPLQTFVYELEIPQTQMIEFSHTFTGFEAQEYETHWLCFG